MTGLLTFLLLLPLLVGIVAVAVSFWRWHVHTRDMSVGRTLISGALGIFAWMPKGLAPDEARRHLLRGVLLLVAVALYAGLLVAVFA